jgi:hypothetical protein
MSKIQGEGDDLSGRKYQEAQHRFAHEGPVEEAARAAAKGQTKTGAGHEAAKQERRRDKTLDDSFPASDPAPASPGAD